MAKTKKTQVKKKVQANWLPVFQVMVGLALVYIGGHKLVTYPCEYSVGLPLLAIAGVLIYLAFPETSPVMEWPEPKPVLKLKGKKPSGKTPVQGAPLFLVMVFTALAVYAFYGSNFVWASIFCSLVVACIIWFNLKSGGENERGPSFEINEELWFWVMMIVAAAIRFAFLNSYDTGLQNDEGNNLTDTLAASVNHTSPFVTGWGGTPMLPYYWYVFLFRIFGAYVWVARLGSALASLGAIYFFYKWTRLWLSPLAALMGAFWLAMSWWFYFFSLSPFHNAILALEEIGAFYFIEKGFRSGRKVHFCWAGLFAASCVMNYVAGRGVPVMLGMMLAAYTLIRGWAFLKTYWKSLAMFFCAFLWLVGPFIIYAFISPGEVWGRVQPGWIAQEYRHSGSYFFLVKSYLWTLVTLWTSNSSVDFRFVVPGMTFMDAVTGFFALMGFGVFIVNIRKPLAWVLIPGIFIGLSANALARLGWPTDLAYIQLVRLSVVIPFLFFPAAWGFDWFLRSYRKINPRGWGWAGIVTVIAIAGPLALNEPVFLSKFAYQAGTWGDHGLSHIRIAEIIAKVEPGHHIMVDSDATSNVVNFILRDQIPNLMGLDLAKDLPIRYKVSKDVILVFSPWRISPEQRKLMDRYYPKAVWTTYDTPWGDHFLYTVNIPMAEINAAQKGKKLLTALP